MSVSYDFSKCENEAKEIQPNAYYVCMYMMAIGMGEITQKNHLEVSARLRMLDCSTMTSPNEDGQPWMNLEMVKALIGSTFNIENESRTKFSSRMFSSLIRDIEYLERAKSKEVA